VGYICQHYVRLINITKFDIHQQLIRFIFPEYIAYLTYQIAGQIVMYALVHVDVIYLFEVYMTN